VIILFSAPVTVLFKVLNSDPILLMAGALTTFVTDTVSIPSRSAAATKPAGGLTIIPVAVPIVRAAAAGAGGLGGWTAGALNGAGATGGRGGC